MIGLRRTLRRSLSAQSVFVLDGEPACDVYHTEAVEQWLHLVKSAAMMVVAGGFLASMVMVGMAAWMWL